MMNSLFLQVSFELALAVVTVLLIPVGYRAIRGPRVADRLLAVDLITTLLIAIVLLLSVIQRQSLMLDIALALSALSFIGTLALTRFIGEGRVF
ncbi:MAG: monovalent cation/H+ antiporter complex subunit F [Phototrophicaceae bacterium]|jgi:multicomponent Na+:H+ antiporter subunit F